jgi:pilus assembly protein FimV
VPAPPAAAGGKQPSAPAEPIAQPGLLDDLLENPLLLPGLGGIAALGAGYALYAMRRRRKVDAFEDSLTTSDTFASNSLFGSTGGQSVDTNQGAFASPGAADVPSTEVDPIAEADVYIAYGREAQAEDILREALVRQPERQPIRFKLLQICAARNDLDAFEVLARQMHEMTDGQGEDWEKAAALGLSLDPLNPLYGDPAAGLPGAAGGLSQVAGARVDSGRDFDFPDLELDLGAPRAATQPGEVPPESLIDAAVTHLEMVAAPSAIEPLEVPAPLSHPAPAFAEAAKASPPAATAAFSADGLPSLDIDLDLDLPAKSVSMASAQTPAGREPAAGASEPSMDFDLDLAALENITQARPELATADARGLPSFDLDLDPVAVQADPDTLSAGGSARWQEMSTKLDLASAYEEIGDKEGARELLQEVISGGDGTQQQKARAMLSKIG